MKPFKKHSLILQFLNTDKLVKKTRLRLVFSTGLFVFRNQRKNTYSCLNYYITIYTVYVYYITIYTVCVYFTRNSKHS